MPDNTRPGRPDDVASLAAIDTAVNPSPWRPGQFAAACGGVEDTAESALVLEQGCSVCGFIIFSCVLDQACVHNIAVKPVLQGRGMGRSLVVAALTEMKHTGATCCHLEVRASNQAARGLYNALGFQLDGVRKNYYPAAGGREDALLMSRQL